jgi:hypothetical protein
MSGCVMSCRSIYLPAISHVLSLVCSPCLLVFLFFSAKKRCRFSEEVLCFSLPCFHHVLLFVLHHPPRRCCCCRLPAVAWGELLHTPSFAKLLCRCNCSGNLVTSCRCRWGAPAHVLPLGRRAATQPSRLEAPPARGHATKCPVGASQWPVPLVPVPELDWSVSCQVVVGWTVLFIRRRTPCLRGPLGIPPP